jgi:hypothetical protein
MISIIKPGEVLDNGWPLNFPHDEPPIPPLPEWFEITLKGDKRSKLYTLAMLMYNFWDAELTRAMKDCDTPQRMAAIDALEWWREFREALL